MKSGHGALGAANDDSIVPAHEAGGSCRTGRHRQCLVRCFVPLQQVLARNYRYSWGPFPCVFFVVAPSPVCRPATRPPLRVSTGNSIHQRHWLLGISVAVVGLLTTLLLAQQQARGRWQRFPRPASCRKRGRFRARWPRAWPRTPKLSIVCAACLWSTPCSAAPSSSVPLRELNVSQRYPSVRNLSFTRYVTAEQRTAFEARVRADTSINPQGLPDFAIHPAGARPEYFVAEYLWPEEGCTGVLGLDISVQPANLSAMHYSRDTGKTVVSAPFDLMQEKDHRTAFVLRAPVFGPAPPGGTPLFLGAVASTSARPTKKKSATSLFTIRSRACPIAGYSGRPAATVSPPNT